MTAKSMVGAGELPEELLAVMADALRVLSHAKRLQIIEMLDLQKEAPVNEIAERLGESQSAISNHLGRMKSAGLIKADRRGRQVWYSIANPQSITILDCIRKKARKAK